MRAAQKWSSCAACILGGFQDQTGWSLGQLNLGILLSLLQEGLVVETSWGRSQPELSYNRLSINPVCTLQWHKFLSWFWVPSILVFCTDTHIQIVLKIHIYNSWNFELDNAQYLKSADCLYYAKITWELPIHSVGIHGATNFKKLSALRMEL